MRINVQGIYNGTFRVPHHRSQWVQLPKLMEWLSFTPTVNLFPTQPDLILFDMNRWEDQSINAEDLVAIL